MEPCREKFGFWDDVATLDHDSCSHVLLGCSVGGDCVELVVQGLPHDDNGVLDHGGGGAEDEVDCAGDDAVAVELPVGLDVQGVLVTQDVATNESGHVSLVPECNGLVSLSTGRVLECHCLGNEPFCSVGCNEEAKSNQFIHAKGT